MATIRDPKDMAAAVAAAQETAKAEGRTATAPNEWPCSPVAVTKTSETEEAAALLIPAPVPAAYAAIWEVLTTVYDLSKDEVVLRGFTDEAKQRDGGTNLGIVGIETNPSTGRRMMTLRINADTMAWTQEWTPEWVMLQFAAAAAFHFRRGGTLNADGSIEMPLVEIPSMCYRMVRLFPRAAKDQFAKCIGSVFTIPGSEQLESMTTHLAAAWHSYSPVKFHAESLVVTDSNMAPIKSIRLLPTSRSKHMRISFIHENLKDVSDDWSLDFNGPGRSGTTAGLVCLYRLLNGTGVTIVTAYD